MTNPNDLIRRGDAIREIDCGGCYGQCANPSSCQKDDVDAINAIPAAPEVLALVRDAERRGKLEGLNIAVAAVCHEMIGGSLAYETISAMITKEASHE